MGKMLEILRKSEREMSKELGSLMTIKLNTTNGNVSLWDLQQENKKLKADILEYQKRNIALSNQVMRLMKAKYEPQLKQPVESIITSLSDAEDLIAKVFDIEKDNLFNPSRKNVNIMTAKHVARFVAVYGFCLSLQEIATHFGKSNHTTILWSKKKIFKWYGDGKMPNIVMQLINSCCGKLIFAPYDSNM